MNVREACPQYFRSGIRDRKHHGRFIDFTGIAFGTAKPIDIDFFQEYHDRVFVLGEFKYAGAEVPEPQEKAIRRLVNHLTGAYACAFIADILTPGLEDVEGRGCPVRAIYTPSQGWHHTHDETVEELITRVCLEHGGNMGRWDAITPRWIDGGHANV